MCLFNVPETVKQYTHTHILLYIGTCFSRQGSCRKDCITHIPLQITHNNNKCTVRWLLLLHSHSMFKCAYTIMHTSAHQKYFSSLHHHRIYLHNYYTRWHTNTYILCIYIACVIFQMEMII